MIIFPHYENLDITLEFANNPLARYLLSPLHQNTLFYSLISIYSHTYCIHIHIYMHVEISFER